MTRMHHEPIPPAMKGFEFRQRKEKINWRLLSTIDVDKIVKNVDINALQSIIENLSFCDLQSEDLSQIDPVFVKLFQLCQLIIEYLLHSQDFLLENRKSVKSEHHELIQENTQLKSTNDSQVKLIEELKREIKAQKKTIYAFQLVSKIPGGNGSSSNAAAYYRCDYCPKTFSSSFYLESHLNRRHAELLPTKPTKVSPTVNVSTPSATPHLETGTVCDVQRITDTVEQFASRVVETERAFRKDLEDRMEQKMNLEIQRRQNLLEEMYKQERLKSVKEIQDLKTTLEKELAEEKIAFREQKNVVETFIRNNRNSSHVGKMEDDDSEIKSSFIHPPSLDTHSFFESKQSKAILDLQERMNKELANVKNLILQKDHLTLDQSKPQEEVPTSPIKTSYTIVETPKKVSFDKHDSVPTISKPNLSKETIQIPIKSALKTNPRMNDIWNAIFKRLSLQKSISQSDSPWARSLYPHDSKLRFIKTKESLFKVLEDTLAKEGIHPDQVLEFWGKDAVLEKDLLDKLEYQILLLEDRSAQDPIYGKMKEYLQNELDHGIKLYYQPPNTILDGFNQTKKEKDASTLRMEILAGKNHRRAVSEDSPKQSLLPPNLSIPKKHDRIPTNFSFDAIQSKFSKILRKRTDSAGSSVESSSSSPKKFGGFGFKKAFKKMGGFIKKKQDVRRSESAQSNSTMATTASPDKASSIRDDISVQSVDTNDLDYSNPNRKIVYSPLNDANLSPLTPRLETISDISDISDKEEITKSVSVEYEESEQDVSQDVSQVESESPIVPPKPVPKETIPQNIIETIQEIKEPIIQEPLSPEKSKNSDDSFNISDLSDVSGNNAIVQKIETKNEQIIVNFSDEEDEDLSSFQIKEPNLPAKVDKIPLAPSTISTIQKERDLEDLLDELEISDLSDLPKPKLINNNNVKVTQAKPKYDDEFDLDELEL